MNDNRDDMHEDGQYELLMVRYLTGDLNHEEEVFVRNLIGKDESARAAFETLKNTWDLVSKRNTLEDIEDINVAEEWKKFNAALTNREANAGLEREQGSAMAEAVTAPMAEAGETVIAAATPARGGLLRKMLVGVSVAASIVLLVLARNKLFVDRPVLPGREITVRQDSEPKVHALAAVRIERNGSDSIRRLVLEDGSRVLLYGKSEIRFPEPFAGDRRDIVLNGKARFDVAGDQSRPFTVISGDIATTALGTLFTVTSFEKDRQILVRLAGGKVVVRPVDRQVTRFGKAIYLLPGQEVIYDKDDKIARLRTLRREEKLAADTDGWAPAGDEPVVDNPSLPGNYKQSWFMFNNEPLTEIFGSLEEMYGIKIIYSKKDVQRLYFIGTFNKSDSVELILQKIASLNNLTVARDNKTFVITKK